MNEVKQKALEHYDRMINWVEKKIKENESFANIQKDRMLMRKKIGESWMGAHCPYCVYVNSDCSTCPLHGWPPLESYKCCNGRWHKMFNSPTWGSWLYAAKKVREYIEVYG